MNIFKYTDYKIILRQLVNEKSKIVKNYNFSLLAQRIRVQRSYISQILNGDYQLSEDQAFLISDELGLLETERDYLCLLVAIARCGTAKRKKALIEKRDRLRKNEISSNKSVIGEEIYSNSQLPLYYNDPFCSLVHMCLSIKSFKQDPRKIKDYLNLSPERIESILLTLERCRILSREEEKIVVKKPSIHLDKESYLSRTNAIQFRLLAINKQQEGADKDGYYFTCSFSADEETRILIKSHFIEFLEKVSRLVKGAEAESIYTINFDLYGY